MVITLNIRISPKIKSFFYSSPSTNQLLTCQLLNVVLYSCSWLHAQSPFNSLQPYELYAARQVPLSMEFSKQEYWSGLMFPTPENLSNPGIKPVFLAVVAMHSGETNSLRRIMQLWSAVYYTCGPKAASPLSQGPRAIFYENLIYPKCICPNPAPQIPWN